MSAGPSLSSHPSGSTTASTSSTMTTQIAPPPPHHTYPQLVPPPGLIPLTPSTSIHPIGSRFLHQIPEQPLCATALPTISASQRRSPNTLNSDRYLLIGTRSSLWAVDMFPDLGKNEKVAEVTVENARCFEVWSGLGVLQLEVFLEEPSNGRKDGVSGIVIGLVEGIEEGASPQVKMWPLQSLVNLVKWRTFTEDSEPVDLAPAPDKEKD
ncbi:hypothetical protein BT69DRAFT_1343733, partial [Atractiella rhizophila]